MATLNLSKPHRTVHVGVILTNGITELVDIAPVDMFSAMSHKFVNEFPDEMTPDGLKSQAMEFEFHWVSEAGPGTPAKLTAGMQMNPTDSFETCPPLDVVLMGAHNIGYQPSEAELAYVRKTWSECTAMLTVCGGIDLPRLAGILDGLTATGPRVLLPMVRMQNPGTNWVERRWVRDGKLWSSGAALNGMDMLGEVARELWGRADEDLSTFINRLGAWPNRDVDYKDVPWAI